MTKNPFLNALAATAYITFVGVFMNWGTRVAPKHDSWLTPIAVISLFTLSAAVMGYVFLYQPGLMVLDGKKKQGVTLFLQTVAVFAVLTMLSLILVFTGAVR